MEGHFDIEEGVMVHSTSTTSMRNLGGIMVRSTSTTSMKKLGGVMVHSTSTASMRNYNAFLKELNKEPGDDSSATTSTHDMKRTSSTKDESDSSKPSSSTGDESDDGISDCKDTTSHHAGPTPISLVASSLVCFTIYFVFCIVFSSVVWEPLSVALDETIDPPFGIPQGVGINLLGIVVGSVFFARKSGCRAVIAGPDLLPVVFFAEAGASVLTFLQTSYADSVGAACEGDGHLRSLAEDDHSMYDSASDPCSDSFHRHLGSEGGKLPAEFMAKVVPTTLVAMMIGNAVTALVFYTLGKMKNTASVIGFIPANVVAGFLTCIGYKVIKLAVLITTGYAFKEKYIKNLGNDLPHINDPWLPLTIALVYGVLLYGLKRSHVIAAEKLILGFILVPIAIFFAIIAISGASMDTMREQDWFLTQARDGQGCVEDCKFTTTKFWQTLQVAYGSGSLVEWGAIPTCIPIFIMGAVMTSLDSMLKLTSSEKALSVDLDYNSEMKLGGKATLLSALLCGSPAYGQTKFNVINFSIARTSDSPLPTVYLGLISLVIFLSGVAGPIINIMPRFLLGGLCVFAGVGFLFENLYEGRKNMNRSEFAIVWVIFLVNFVWEFFVLQNLPTNIQPMVPGLLVVFILGMVLSTFQFMFTFMRKAKPPTIRSGDMCCSSCLRSEKHDAQLAVMAPWFQVFSIDSFVFFGTANNVYQQLKAHLADQKVSKPRAERTKYLIFDLSEVTGIDSSSKDVFFKVRRILKAEGMSLVWAVRNPKIVEKFTNWGLFDGSARCNTLDLALRFVEDKLLLRAHGLSDKWLANPTVRKIFERQVLTNVFSISVRSDEKNFSSARLQPWAQRIDIQEGQTLCGPDDDSLYMLSAGEVQIQGRDCQDYSVFTGSFFNLDRLLLSIGAMSGVPSTLGACATRNSMALVVTRKKFMQMQKEDGALAQKLLMTLIVQNEMNRPGRVRPLARVRAGPMGQIEQTPGLDAKNGSATMAERILKGNDYKIQLTEAQEESFKRIYEIINEHNEKEIPMKQFETFVLREAKSLGSQIHRKQFMEMIDHSGIDEDGDGLLSVEEFLHFLRGLFLANIPSAELPALRHAYDAAVAKAPDQPMDETRVQVLFFKLGFNVTSAGWQDVMGVIDADGDGDVDFEEFLTGIGMMKKLCILSTKLDSAFQDYKEQSTANKRSCRRQNFAATKSKLHSMPSIFKSSIMMDKRTAHSERGCSMRNLTFKASSTRQLAVSQEDIDEFSQTDTGIELDASDLEAFLNIPRKMAEEMIFLADQDEVEAVQNDQGCNESIASVKCARTIDRDEFQQLLRNWS